MGAELRRKAQLVDAAIAVIGETGSLEVTVGKIAKRAGVSPALAFHYFGDKERLFLGAMRHVLRVFGSDVKTALRAATTPRERVEGVIHACFTPTNFKPGVISAWLNFYVLAYRADEARRLLAVYHRRMQTNLTHDLRPLAGAQAPAIAQRLLALIDGLYLHYAHDSAPDAGQRAEAHVLAALDNELKALT